MFEEGHTGDDAGFATGGEGVQLELGGNEGRGKLGIGGCTGTSTPDLWGNIMKLLAVLVGDDRTARGSRIGSDLRRSVRVETGGDLREGNKVAYHNAAVIYASHDGSSRAGSLRQRYASCMQSRIAVVV